MRRRNVSASLMAIATAAAVVGLSAGASAADRLNIKLDMAGAKAADGLKARAETNARKKLHELGRDGVLNGRTLSEDGAAPKVLGVTITIVGKDDADEDEDADLYEVHLELSDGGAPFVIDVPDKHEDPNGTELLTHLDEALVDLVQELSRRHE
jgi:hypothetical protein